MIAEHMEALRRILDKIVELCVQYAFEAVGAIVIMVAGVITARVVGGFVKRWLDRYHVDVTIVKFLVQMVTIAVYAIALVMALSKFGFNVAPLVAGLSVVGFGTSFALQGPLSNYAAGATLIFTKPFKVGDIIEVVNATGEVADIALARTVIRTVDGTTIVVPNKHIIGEVIQNFSRLKRVDFAIGISYQSSPERAIAVIHDVLTSEPRITQTPPTKVGIRSFGESSINLEAKASCRQADYWDVLYTVNQRIYARLTQAGIEIPFPQRDVHIRTAASTVAA